MTEAFEQRGIDSPRLSAEILLSHVLRCERLRLYMEVDRPASSQEREALRALVSRALTHEPIQYLTGEAWFFGLPFAVDRRVLIPRPSTETIVEHVLQHQRSADATASATGEGLVIADICTGSGCIAVALASRLREAKLIATDNSTDALAVARGNAVRHQVAERIVFAQGDLLEPLRERLAATGRADVDVLVSNPPYIPDHEWPNVAPNVKDHEPTSALRGGEDGLEFVRPLLAEGPDLLRTGGKLLIEVAASTASQAAAKAEANERLTDVRVIRDVDQLPRVIVARRR